MTPPLLPRLHADGFSDDAVDRLLAGKSTPEELERFQAYLLTSQTDAAWVAVLRQYELTPSADFHTDLKDGTAEALLAKWRGPAVSAVDVTTSEVARFEGGPRGKQSPPSHHLITQRGWWTTLLSVSMLALVVWGAWLARVHAPVSRAVAQTYQTAPGQTATVQLADGSHMTLAPSTTVHVHSNIVTVEGAAYFHVTAHSGRPFMVQTGNTMVRVLGTTFLVRHYLDEQTSRIVVEDGKVALQLLGNSWRSSARLPSSVVLVARTLALVSDSGISVTPNIAVRDYTAWTRGILVFDKVPLCDVVAELGRAYGATIRVNDSVLAKKPMILEVPVADLSLTQVLDIVGQTVNARYVVDGHLYVLSPGYTAKQAAPRTRFPEPEQQYGR